MQAIVHYSLHFVFPALVAYVFFRAHWQKTYLIFLATMLVDLDHLLANPIFQPDRCSIGFHPLHSFYVIPLYIALLFCKKPYRLIGIGLMLHIFTDFIDCLMTFAHCHSCMGESILGRMME